MHSLPHVAHPHLHRPSPRSAAVPRPVLHAPAPIVVLPDTDAGEVRREALLWLHDLADSLDED